MIKKILFLTIVFSVCFCQKKTPASYWESLEMKEKKYHLLMVSMRLVQN